MVALSGSEIDWHQLHDSAYNLANFVRTLPLLKDLANMVAFRTTLITGGAGYIGSHAVLAFQDADLPVVVLDDLSTGRRDRVPADIPFVEGDAGDAAIVGEIIRSHEIATVVHFAGSIVVPESVPIHSNTIAITPA